MAFEIYWYDFICYGIVGVAFIGALYVLRLKEGAGAARRGHLGYSQSLLSPFREYQPRRGHLSYSQLWTSCWRGLHPAWLLALRFFSFLILCGFLAWDIREWDLSIFFYYTEWTFTLVIIYFAIGTVISAHGCVLYYSKKANAEKPGRGHLVGDVEHNNVPVPGSGVQSLYDNEAMQERAGFWGYLMQTSYQTCAGAIIMTDIVFWCIIVPFLSNAHLQVNLLMGGMHSLNALLLLLDTSVNSLPFPWFRLGYYVLWSCSYVIFQWIIHACGYTWWPYPFLEMSTPWAAFWYFCMAAIHIPCYGIYFLFVKAKNSIFAKSFPDAFVRC